MTLWAWPVSGSTINPNNTAMRTAFGTYAIAHGVYAQAAVAYAQASAGTATYNVPITGQSVTVINNVPIPLGTKVGGTFDKSLTIKNFTGTLGYDFGFATYDATTQKITKSAGGATYVPGTDAYETGPGANTTNSGNAACFPLWAGLVFPAEIAAGLAAISHNLHFTAPNLGPAPNPYPARPNSLGYPSGTGIPLGTWACIDPTVDVTVLGLSAFELWIARALQLYGMFCRDIGSTVSIILSDEINQGGNGTNWPAVGVSLPLLNAGYPYARQFSATFTTLLQNHIQFLLSPSTLAPSNVPSGPHAELILDTATRADENPNTDSGLWAGSPLATGLANSLLKITSNKFAWITAAGSQYWLTSLGGDQAVFVQVDTLPGAGNSVRIWTRVASPGAAPNGYDLRYVQGTGFIFDRIDAGVRAQIGSTISGSLAAGDAFALSVIGSTLTAWKFTAGAWASLGTTTDATYSAGGFVGLEVRDSAARLSQFGGGTIATPVNTVAPVVSGTLGVGNVLTTTNGTWTGIPSNVFGYQWQRDAGAGFVNVVGEVAQTYTQLISDVGANFQCVLTGTNSLGAHSVLSNEVGPVPSNVIPTTNPVPDIYDVVVDGHGYIFWNALMQSLPFRNQRAAYYFSETFLERTNVSGNYGDDSQSFWLTATQNDWSEGEGRKFFRTSDADLVRRFWRSSAVDVTTVPGQVSLAPTWNTSATFGSDVFGACKGIGGGTCPVYTVSTTNLFRVSAAVGDPASQTGLGAHGCGAAPSLWGMACDGLGLFISSTAGGTVGVRRYDIAGASFSTFSATPADSLCFLNNTLFGYKNSNSTLYTYDTAGTATSSFQWKAADGSSIAAPAQIAAFGGKIQILRYGTLTELWEFDGVGVDKLTDFPQDFVGSEIKVVAGVTFVSGLVNVLGSYYPTIYYYANGTLGQLWRANTPSLLPTQANTYPAMAPYGEGLAFTDSSTSSVMQYDIAFGGVHQIGSYTVTTDPVTMAGSGSELIVTNNQLTAYTYPGTAAESFGFVSSSLFDFDNSLAKICRGVTVEFDDAATGDGGTVDLYYQFDTLDQGYTLLQTNVSSGVEYLLPDNECHSVSIQTYLNKGTSTAGPVLKRVFVRAVPLLNTYRRVEYVLDLTGTRPAGGAIVNPVQLHNGQEMPLSGLEQAANLTQAMVSRAPIQITDRFGTYQGVFEPGAGVTEYDEVRPGEFIVKCTLREV